MGIFAEWRRRRELKRSADLVIKMLIEHIENGGDVADLFVISLREPVEWDQDGQFWYVRLLVEWEWDLLQEGRRVSLESGRGGAFEEAVVVEDLGGGKFRLDLGMEE